MGRRFGSVVELPGMATPTANPPTGAYLLYFKSDGKLYRKNSAGVEEAVASGGSGAGMLSGLGAPTNSVGSPGEFYFDDANNILYGPKSIGDGLGTPMWAQTAANVPDTTTVGDYRLGNVYKVLTAGQITGARFYRNSAAAVQARTLQLYENGTLVATSNATSETATTGWVSVTFPTPYTVTPGNDYTIVYRTPSSGPYVSKGTAPTMTDSAQVAWVAGRYDVGTAGHPSQVAATSNFFIDIEFKPSSALWPPALPIVPTQATEPTGTPDGHLWWDTDEPDPAVSLVANTRLIAAGVGLTGGGSLAADRTLAVDFAASGASSSTKAVRADDSRLSDSRTPSAHNHAGTEITSGTVDHQRLGNVVLRLFWSGSAWPSRPTGAYSVDWVSPVGTTTPPWTSNDTWTQY